MFILEILETCTIQGSRLDPILYVIFVSLLFDLEKMTNYADNNFIIRWEKDLVKVIPDMEKSLEAITIIELNISDFWRVCLHGLPYLGN